jgi:hypothetical protein
MALVKPPKLDPIKPPPAPKPPPVSKTQDNYTHHTSPVAGPQPEPPTQLPDNSSPKARLRTLPDTPMHVTKHSNPVGRPKNRNDG